MAHWAFITWDGGGNVSVALGIGAELLRRGHRVSVLGPKSLRRVIVDAGLEHAEFGVSPPTESSARSAYLVEVVSSTALEDQLPAMLAAVNPDGLVIDCNLSWAMGVRLAIPAAVLVHTAFGLYLPVWQPVIDAANERRRTVGLRPFSAAAQAWSGHDLLLVTSLASFDRTPSPLPANAVYVGVVTPPKRTAGNPSPRSKVPLAPLVLVSYSTDPLQNSPNRIQAALDGLATLPVQVLATTSRTFEATLLSVPANATVVDDVSHNDVLPMVAVMVCHAGHGTTLSALCHGVPIVCVPGIGRDQTPIADRVAELGLGIALHANCTPADINKAVNSILGDPAFRSRTTAFKRHCAEHAGAAMAADMLERMLH